MAEFFFHIGLRLVVYRKQNQVPCRFYNKFLMHMHEELNGDPAKVGNHNPAPQLQNLLETSVSELW